MRDPSTATPERMAAVARIREEWLMRLAQSYVKDEALREEMLASVRELRQIRREYELRLATVA